MKRFDSTVLLCHAAIPDHINHLLKDASIHALDTNGSFIRAKLAASVGEYYGMRADKAEALGAAVELFHLASLLLDDLPCMDDAATRRSKSCTHKVYGEATTILSALGYINRAYSLLWNLFSDTSTDCQRRASQLAEDCLGFTGILDGQARDIHFGTSLGKGEEVELIGKKKTGALIRICLLLPAILQEAPRYDQLHLANLAEIWGVAYQVADDLKDIYLSETASGKTAGRDASLGRPNMALAVGEEAAARFLDDLLASADKSLRQLGSLGVLHHFQSILRERSKDLIAAYVAA